MAHREDILHRLVRNFSLRGLLLHPATLFVMASLGVLVTAISLWNQYHVDIINPETYLLTEDKIQITPPPKYCQADLKRLLLDQAANDPDATLLNADLVPRTVSLFQSVGWVEQVRSVKKTMAGLEVDVQYRKPVAMVELNPITVPGWSRDQQAKVLPVDQHGMIMPASLIADQDLIRVSVYDPIQSSDLTVWSDWPDARIKDAAAISAMFSEQWQELGLFRIVTFRSPTDSKDALTPFELWPDQGTQVIWGNAPGQEIEGEAKAEEKLLRLIEFVQQYGALNNLPEQKIDLRSGQAVLVNRTKTAQLKFKQIAK